MATNNITVDIPAVMIDNRVTAMIQEMAMRLEQQGMKLEQYLQYAGTDIAKLREQYRETAEKNVKTDLMLEEVAKAEDIKVEAKDLDEEVAAMAVLTVLRRSRSRRSSRNRVVLAIWLHPYSARRRLSSSSITSPNKIPDMGVYL